MKYLFYIFFFLFCAATTVTAQTVSQVRSQSTDPTYTPSGAVTAPPLCYNRTTHHLWGYAGGYWYDLTGGTYVDLDPSPTNEKIVSFSVVAGVLRINENGIFYNVPINDIIAAANISSASPTITVTNVAGVVTVTSTDPDESVTNELQNLNLAGQTLSISNGNNVALPVVGVTAGTGISTSVAGGTVTITNTSPDQTVTVTGAGINTVTGTYPNFTVTATEVDGDISNECNTAFAVTVDSLKITDNCGTLGVPLTAFGTPTLADNGLSMAGDTVHLGGALHQNTTVTQNGYEMIFTDTHANGDVSQIYQGDNFLGALPAVGQSYVTPTSTNSYVVSHADQNDVGVEGSIGSATFTQTNNATDLFNRLSTNDSGATNGKLILFSDSLITTITGAANYNTFAVYENSIKSTAYPQTRDDSGTTPPINFLYTDANGVVQSAPTALIASDVCEGLQSLPIGTPQPTNKIVYIGSTAPAGYIGYDFDLPADFGSTDATDTYFHILYLNTAYWYPPATSSPSTPIVIAGNEAAINTFIQNSLIADGFVGDEFTLVVNADNTITIWVKPTYTPNGNEFWWGSSTPDDYTNKIFPTIPTTHFTTGCFLGDAPSGAAKVANGLYTSNDTIKLGGALIENTLIANDIYNLENSVIDPFGNALTEGNYYNNAGFGNGFSVRETKLENTAQQAKVNEVWFGDGAGAKPTIEWSATNIATNEQSAMQLKPGAMTLESNKIVQIAVTDAAGDLIIVPPNSGTATAGDVLTLMPSGSTLWQPAAAQDTTAWRLTGNAGTDGGTLNFLGTTDAQDLVLKTNSSEIAQFGQQGNAAIGSDLTGIAPALIAPTANNIGSMAFQSGQATGLYSTAFHLATASGDGSMAWGVVEGSLPTTASGSTSTAWGLSAIASGEASTAFGRGNVASGRFSVSFGDGTIASGNTSTAWGKGTTASGIASTAFGYGTTAPSYAETTIGIHPKNYIPINANGHNPLDRLFTIGNGTSAGVAANNALTMWKDGRSMWNGDVAKQNTWIGVNGTNAQNFINVTTPTGSLAAISTEHTPSGNYAVLGSNAGNSGLTINNTKQFAFTTTAGTTSTALGATTTVANYSNTGFLFGGGGTAAANLHLAGSEACDYTTIAATTTLLPTNRMVYVNNGATNITITIPAGDKLLYTITRLDNTSTGIITVQLAGGTIQDVGGTIGATTSISAVAGQRSETFHVTGTVARRTTNQ